MNKFFLITKTHSSIFANDKRERLVKPTVVTFSIEHSLTVSVQLGVIILNEINHQIRRRSLIELKMRITNRIKVKILVVQRHHKCSAFNDI